MSGEIKQFYKNRAEAFRLFIAAQKLPVSQAKFYQDADRLGLPDSDKTIKLSALLAYVKDDLKISLSTGESLTQRNRSQETEDLELRKLKAETERKERENEDSARALDKLWLHRDAAEEALAGLVGALQDALDHQIYSGVPGLIHTAAGEPGRIDEVTESLKVMVSNAFSEVLATEKIEGILELANDAEPADE